MSTQKKVLMVIIPDRLSEILEKGEVTDRYYNPGEVFEEVHIVMTNDDQPDISKLQQTVGAAKLVVHNVSAGKKLFIMTLGWQPLLLKLWARKLLALAEQIQPVLIRCHGAHLNTFGAAAIKKKLGIPYIVSLHINPDEDVRARAKGFLAIWVSKAQERLERIGLQSADLVMPVYRPIVPFLERLGIKNYEVCYNVLNPAYLRCKDDYALQKPIKIVSVGRQLVEKNPIHLIKAVGELNDVHLTLFGTGPIHENLKAQVRDLGIEDKITFVKAISNDALCQVLPDFDLFAVHTEYWEISKSVLEPLLTGLPIIINKRIGDPVPELTDEICVLVENSVDSYKTAIHDLITDHAKREALGRSAYTHAQSNWSPATTEAKFAQIYRAHMLK